MLGHSHSKISEDELLRGGYHPRQKAPHCWASNERGNPLNTNEHDHQPEHWPLEAMASASTRERPKSAALSTSWARILSAR